MKLRKHGGPDDAADAPDPKKARVDQGTLDFKLACGDIAPADEQIIKRLKNQWQTYRDGYGSQFGVVNAYATYINELLPPGFDQWAFSWSKREECRITLEACEQERSLQKLRDILGT
jgi:hypothetical protein